MLAAAYDDDRLLGAHARRAYLPVAFALQAPQWVFFKRMDYVRLRTLQAIVPLGTVARRRCRCCSRASACGRS